MSDQAPEQDTDQEAGRVESLDARFGAIETKQAEQDGKLDQILSRLSGAAAGEGKTHAAAQAHTEQRLDQGSSIADQVKAAVAAVGAEQAQKEAADKHAADHQALAEMREKKPRESTAGWRGKLQRAMYGQEPS